MKATYQEVKQLIDNTNWNNKTFSKKSQPFLDELGYFSPASANWAYRLGIAKGEDNNFYYVVTVYGEVKGFRKVNA